MPENAVTPAAPPIRRNAAWALLGQLSRVLIQMGYFVILARVLKPVEYGAFVSVAALGSAMSAFSGMGSGHILIREVVRDRTQFARSWGLALAAHLSFGTLFLLLLVALSPWLLPVQVHLPLILTVGVADLIFGRMSDLSVQSFQSVHDARRMVVVQFTSAGARLLGACVLAVQHGPKSATSWGVLYLITSAGSTLFAIFLVSKTIDWPTFQFERERLRPQLIEGFHFATSLSAETIYNDIDKTMLGRMASLDAAAIYSVAYRFIEAATVPIRALALATYPVFFERGVGGVAATYKFAKTILPRSVAYGAFASVALFLSAPLLPLLMGAAYHDSALALRWLCLIPFLRSIHAFLLDVLTGADKQSVRSGVQWTVAAVNVAINVWLIRAYAWRGASLSSILCDGLLVVGLEVCILRLIRRAPVTVVPA